MIGKTNAVGSGGLKSDIIKRKLLFSESTRMSLGRFNIQIGTSTDKTAYRATEFGNPVKAYCLEDVLVEYNTASYMYGYSTYNNYVTDASGVIPISDVVATFKTKFNNTFISGDDGTYTFGVYIGGTLQNASDYTMNILEDCTFTVSNNEIVDVNLGDGNLIGFDESDSNDYLYALIRKIY